jgi:transcriptional regulator with XRE-family HTH domain
MTQNPHEGGAAVVSAEAAVAETESSLAGRLRICAKLAGSGDELSRKAAIPRRTLETYLTGEAEPKISRLIAIADAAGVSLQWLATGELPVHTMKRLAGFREDVGRYGSADSAPALDADLMRNCIVAVEELLQEWDKPLPLDKKAELITLVYELELEERAKGKAGASGAEIVRLFKRVAEV